MDKFKYVAEKTLVFVGTLFLTVAFLDWFVGGGTVIWEVSALVGVVWVVGLLNGMAYHG